MTVFDSAPLRRRAEQLALTLLTDTEIEGGQIRKAGVRTVARVFGLQPATFYRPQLSAWVVDRYCVALGCHPLELYPDFCEDVA